MTDLLYCEYEDVDELRLKTYESGMIIENAFLLLECYLLRIIRFMYGSRAYEGPCKSGISAAYRARRSNVGSLSVSRRG